MRIALINGGNNTEDIVRAFINLGHEIVNVNAEALFTLLSTNVDAIYGCNISYRKLVIISQITKKPIADFRWCCRHLAALLNTRHGGAHDLTH